MNIYFHIEYHTVFGEELVLNIVRKNEDGKETTAQYRMATTDGRQWTYALNNYRAPATAQGAGDVLDYFYSVDNNGSEERTEWRTVAHRLELKPADALCFHVYDRWIDMPEDSYLYSSAFTDCLRRSTPQPVPARGEERKRSRWVAHPSSHRACSAAVGRTAACCCRRERRAGLLES